MVRGADESKISPRCENLSETSFPDRMGIYLLQFDLNHIEDELLNALICSYSRLFHQICKLLLAVNIKLNKIILGPI